MCSEDPFQGTIAVAVDGAAAAEAGAEEAHFLAVGNVAAVAAAASDLEEAHSAAVDRLVVVGSAAAAVAAVAREEKRAVEGMIDRLAEAQSTAVGPVDLVGGLSRVSVSLVNDLLSMSMWRWRTITTFLGWCYS